MKRSSGVSNLPDVYSSNLAADRLFEALIDLTVDDKAEATTGNYYAVAVVRKTKPGHSNLLLTTACRAGSRESTRAGLSANNR